MAGKKPPRILAYGVQGVGKTGMIANAPAPVIIPTEDGLGKYDVDAFPLCRSYDEVMAALNVIATSDHKWLTLGLDSLDWFEPMVWAKVVENYNQTATKKIRNIEEIGYGKGYVLALDLWREYLDALNYIRDHKNMGIIQTAHAQIRRFDSPETDSYDRYYVKLHKTAEGLVQEHSDCVFFINYFTATKNQEVGFNKDVTRAVGAGDRYLHTQEKPAYHAKNRYGLPEKIKFDKEGAYWTVLAQHIPAYQHLLAPQQPQTAQG